MNLVNKYKHIFIKGFIILFLFMMVIFPGASFQGASTGLLLWFHNVLPNLLPFIIISNLMIRLNVTRQLSKVFYPVLGRLFGVSCEGCYPIVIGFLSGIPMGAKTTSDLVNENKINRNEGQFLLAMCNNASPMFIIGYIAITQLKLPHIKYALFFILYASAIVSALLWRFLNDHLENKEETHDKTDNMMLQAQSNPVNPSFSFQLLDNSIMNGFEVVTRIGGYIILFNILAQIIKEVGPDFGFLKAFIMGIVEITTGINQISNTQLHTNIKIVLIVVLTSFGGISGMAQTKSVLGDSGLSMKTYVIVKLMNAAISLLLASLYVTLVHS
ncbi:transporter [Lachnospiraceae bacterium MD1]|jgi:sporulation integral membrane protein YlbJ|uniref:Transporter n=1 Tax=Variimorphobacter saccharofermentans TaxID=2755051 RepID=A0A839K384_9FIRM|nr:transporter [Variimorphobacter saccharofermentans]MBB2183652.1 transporter [Variimorphobacter saccharofermentans]